MRNLFRSDRGATDPILVIAAIVVSLVLLVGGSFTVSGIVQSAKDSNAKTQLQLIAAAESAAKADGTVNAAGADSGSLAFTGSGPYLSWKVTKDGTVSGDRTLSGDFLNEAGAVSFSPSPDVVTEVAANNDSWVAGALSTSGRQFWMSDKQSTIFTGSIPTGKFDPALTLPVLVPPYDAGVECATKNITNAIVRDSSRSLTLTPAVMTKAGDKSVRIAFTATGRQLCDWATVFGLNLSGDRFTGNYETARVTVYRQVNGANTPDYTTGSGGELVLTTDDTAIDGTRTVTMTFNFSGPTYSTYASVDDYVTAWNRDGGTVFLYRDTVRASFYHSGALLS